MARSDQKSIAERRHSILLDVCMNREVSIATLAQKYNTSQMTIWRDLEHLDKNHYIQKTQTGKIKKSQVLSLDPNIYSRSEDHHAEKVAIALKAIDLISDNDIIGIDNSTTAMELARLLFTKESITVVSNNMLLMPILYGHPKLKFISAGGALKFSGYSTEGELAISTIQQFNYDKVFFSGNAADAEFGLSNTDEFETGTKRAFLRNALQAILLCDHSKLGKKAVYRFCETRNIDILITDSEAEDKQIRAFEENGVRVIVADEIRDKAV